MLKQKNLKIFFGGVTKEFDKGNRRLVRLVEILRDKNVLSNEEVEEIFMTNPFGEKRLRKLVKILRDKNAINDEEVKYILSD
ncbi:MAG: hypothetical protein ABH808_03010 [Candidatus Kuenenbacteria bacterium]